LKIFERSGFLHITQAIILPNDNQTPSRRARV
jgi:hypothetical protein